MTRPIPKTAFASLLSCLLAFSLLTASERSTAQDFSHDGNRWYEVEVSIFRNVGIPSQYPEVTFPTDIDPGYPPALRQLRTVLDALKYDFPEADTERDDPVRSADYRPPFTPAPVRDARPADQQPVMGPPPARQARDFRLPDPDRDAFLRIEDRVSEFTTHNQRLNRSASHRLLWHAVWRQPVLNRAGAEAILVTGGDRYGLHHELEGSLMLSFNVNRIDVDSRLWVSTFSTASSATTTSPDTARNPREPLFGDTALSTDGRRPGDGSSTEAALASFRLPPVPGSRDETDPPPSEVNGEREASRFPRFRSTSQASGDNRFRVTGIAYMAQQRAMISHELHYLDHPDFGVLIEVRPYQLPDPLASD